MKIRTFALLYLALFITAPATTFAAGEKAGKTARDHNGNNPFSAGVSYFGEMITHPGFSVNLEYELHAKGSYQLILAGRTGWYVHIRNHKAIFLEPGLVNRLTAPSGFFADALLGIGYFLRSPDGIVYGLDDAGNVGAVGSTWHSRLSLGAYLGIGWDFGKKGTIPLSLFIRAGALGEYPYKGYLLPHAVLESGIRIGM